METGMMSQGFSGFILAVALPAIGSAIGCGMAGQAAVGAWKKAFTAGKGANMAMLALVGASLTQALYGFVLMLFIVPNSGVVTPIANSIAMFSGLAIGITAYFQGKIGAYGIDALGETGKGFGQYLIAMGIVETIAIFVLVFTIVSLGSI